MAMVRFAVASAMLIASIGAGTAGAQERDFQWGNTVLLPRLGTPDDPDKLARCDYLWRGEASWLWFGNVIQIPAPYNDGLHEFVVYDGLMGATTGADFDVTFLPDLGTCPEPPPSPTRFHNPGDERGIVPAGTRWMVMTMSSPHTPTATGVIEIKGR